MFGGTRKNKKGKGLGSRSTKDVEMKISQSLISKKKNTTKKKDDLKKKLKKVIDDQIKISLIKPSFKSILAGDLYKYFYSRHPPGPYHLFETTKEFYAGKEIPLHIFTRDSKNGELCQKIRETIGLLTQDLITLQSIPEVASKISIPSLDDDMSKLILNFGIQDNKSKT